MPRTLHVVPVTSNVRRAMATDVPLDADGLDQHSVARCHLPTVAEIERVVDDGGRGNVGPLALARLRSVIADLLDIG